MKKLLAVLLCFFTIGMAGCGATSQGQECSGTEQTNHSFVTGDKTESTTQPTDTVETNSTENPPATDEWLFRKGYKDGNVMVETPTRVLYMYSDQLFYYNKIDGESYIFCFDPLCDHQLSTCISYKFTMTGIMGGTQGIEYCAYNNRFYALRGQKLCSFNFDGGDIKIEYSFGENGGWDELYYDPFGLYSLKIYDHYAYMITIDSETGDRNLMRYDVASGEMRELTSQTDIYVSNYLLGYDCLYLFVLGEEGTALYRSNLDMEEIALVPGIEGSSASGIFDGERLYFIEYRYDYDSLTDTTEETPLALVALDFRRGEVVRLQMLEQDAVPRLLAVTDEYIYYTIYEPRYLGTMTDTRGNKNISYNSFSRLYRMEKDGSSPTVILDDISCEVLETCFLGSEILILGSICRVIEEAPTKEGGLMLARLDNAGFVTSIEKVEILE